LLSERKKKRGSLWAFQKGKSPGGSEKKKTEEREAKPSGGEDPGISVYLA